MKTNTLLFIASLAVLATSASAAVSQTESDVVILPTYVVTAPRHQVIAQRIEASLNELKQQAHLPLFDVTDLCRLEVPALFSPETVRSAQGKKTIRVAKL